MRPGAEAALAKAHDSRMSQADAQLAQAQAGELVRHPLIGDWHVSRLEQALLASMQDTAQWAVPAPRLLTNGTFVYMLCVYIGPIYECMHPYTRECMYVSLRARGACVCGACTCAMVCMLEWECAYGVYVYLSSA